MIRIVELQDKTFIIAHEIKAVQKVKPITEQGISKWFFNIVVNPSAPRAYQYKETYNSENSQEVYDTVEVKRQLLKEWLLNEDAENKILQL